MQKLDLAIDLGTTFLKGVSFFPEGKRLRILRFSKIDYDPALLTDFGKKIKAIISNLKGRYDFNSAVIGCGEGVGKGNIKKGSFLRKFPLAPLSEEELKDIIKNIQKNSLSEIEKMPNKRKFFLVLAKIESISIDGHKVFSPVGLAGRKISFKIVNFYLPLKIYQLLKKIFRSFNIEKFSFEYIPEILPDFLSDYTGKDRSEIEHIGSKIKFFIDGGGKNTQVSIFQKGEIEKVIEIPFGGEVFIKRIQKGLGIKPEQLSFKSNRERIEFKIKKSDIPWPSQQKIIQDILEDESEKWLRKLTPVFERYREEKLPFEMYFFGGGSTFLLPDRIKTELARKSFSCIIKKISPLNLKGIFNFSEDDLQMTIPLLICKTLLKK